MDKSLLPVINFLNMHVVINKHLFISVLKVLPCIGVRHFLILGGLLLVSEVFFLEVPIIIVVVVHDEIVCEIGAAVGVDRGILGRLLLLIELGHCLLSL